MNYISRINSSSTLVEVINSGLAKRDVASLALTLSSVSYGAGQILSGIMGTKFRPQNIIFLGFLIAATANILVSVLPKESVFLIPMWTVNGFAHALMWPPLVAIMIRYLNEKEYQRGCVNVSIASSAGTIVVYLVSPIIISVLSVRYVFAICGIAALGMAFLWKIVFEKMTGEGRALSNAQGFIKNAQNGQSAFEKRSGAFFVVLIAVMLGIIIQSALRDGVTIWMPSYVSETFNLSGQIAILLGVILPVFSMISFKGAFLVYSKFLKNEMICAAVICFIATVFSVILAKFSDSNVLVSMLFSALIAGCMHGINLVLICMASSCLAKYGKVTMFSGNFNACTYVGSAISTYGFAIISQNSGWSATIKLWAICSAVGMVVCFGFAGVYKKFISK